MSQCDEDSIKQLNVAQNFLELSSNHDSCATLRSSGCIQILVQMLHVDASSEDECGIRKCASQTLYNIINNNPIEKDRRRELKILRLLNQILEYSNFLKTLLQIGGEAIADDEDRHPLTAISLLMKSSFDGEHRHTMCELGALNAVPNLVYLDYAVHGPASDAKCCNSLRRYALMALTNLTFGDEANKAYLCGQKQFMEVVITLLSNAPDDLLQVVASVLRNLSWRADKNMKTIFNEFGTVTALAQAAMKHTNENTLKAILSALWNLSAHCSTNKAEFCSVNGALAFLVKMLSYDGPSKTMKIIENAGGILRNVSSHIAVCEQYRQILRNNNCLSILVQQLKSDNIAVVSNACGTLWNLSARCVKDQKLLLDFGAVPLLRTLANSKNSMIAEGSASALKNLITFRDTQNALDTEEVQCLNSNISTLKRRYSQQHQIQSSNIQLTAPGIAAATGTTRVLLTQSCKSPNSVYSSTSDTTLQSNDSLSRKTPQLLNYSTATEVEIIEEQPIDYSMKYNHEAQANKNLNAGSGYTETELDQPTNFSILYLENKVKPPTSIRSSQSNSSRISNNHNNNISNSKSVTKSSVEILLILDDGLQRYQQKTTPITSRLLTKAASATDLRANKHFGKELNTAVLRTQALENLAKPQHQSERSQTSGTHTPPERPINYCEEGTPGYFSRYDSLNSLTDITAVNELSRELSKVSENETIVNNTEARVSEIKQNSGPKESQIINSAIETPLMFSRRSSMDSLVNEVDIGNCEDTGSVISDYSRMQSGVISPSDIPDSPTQSMLNVRQEQQRHIRDQQQSQQKQRNEQQHQHHQQKSPEQTAQQQFHSVNNNLQNVISSVFEDDLNTFHVKNTPANFSCATSLSNLSGLEFNDNNTASKIMVTKVTVNNDIISKDTNGNNETQEKIETNYITKTHVTTSKPTPNTNALVQEQFNELSSAVVNYDLKALSICNNVTNIPAMTMEDPIMKMRRGALPVYLSAADEINNYLEESSPCNYSIISGLSNLTVGSEFAGPARHLSKPLAKPTASPGSSTTPPILPPRKNTSQSSVQIKQRLTDSLSSLSMDSDDDTQLLSQAIAAGSRSKTDNNILHKSSLPQIITTQETTSKTVYSSDDSVDDGQSKSLFEQCIRTGMHKSNDALNDGPNHKSNTAVINLGRASLPRSLGRQIHEKRRAQLQDRKLLSECINMRIGRSSMSGLDQRSQQLQQSGSTGTGKQPSVSSQVRHFENLLAAHGNKKHTNTANQLPKFNNGQHWV